MKYTSEYINSLSFDEYRRLIVKELNDNGYRVSGKEEYKIKDYLPKNALMFSFMIFPPFNSGILS